MHAVCGSISETRFSPVTATCTLHFSSLISVPIGGRFPATVCTTTSTRANQLSDPNLALWSASFSSPSPRRLPDSFFSNSIALPGGNRSLFSPDQLSGWLNRIESNTGDRCAVQAISLSLFAERHLHSLAGAFVSSANVKAVNLYMSSCSLITEFAY